MAKKTFESALARLEQISEELEDGNLSLEASLKKFDEGIKLAEFCNAKLSEAYVPNLEEFFLDLTAGETRSLLPDAEEVPS